MSLNWLCFFLFFYSFDIFGLEKQTIFWIISEADPPYYINEGPFKDQGLGNEFINLVKEKISAYDHKTIIGTSLRSMEMTQKHTDGNTYCSAISGINEKDRTVSIPNAIVKINAGIYFKKTSHPPFSSNDEWLDTKMLLETKAKGVLFQPIKRIMPELENHPYINFSGKRKNLHLLLFSERVDFINSSLEEIEFNKKELQKSFDYDFKLFKITLFTPNITSAIYKKFLDNGRDLTVGYTYVACSQTEIGQLLIKEINKMLLELRTTDRYKKMVFKWIPENMQTRLALPYEHFASSTVPPGTTTVY